VQGWGGVDKLTVATIKRWPTSEETPLPELFGISEDLMSAWLLFQNVEVVSGSISIRLNQYEVHDALVSAAIIKYLRSFGTGVRLKLAIEDVVGISATLLALHNRLKAFIDRHIWNAVSGFETASVFVSVHDDGTDHAHIRGVSSGGRSSLMLSSVEIVRAVELCSVVMEHVRRLMADESSRLLAIAQRLTVAEINALPIGPVEPNPNPMSRR